MRANDMIWIFALLLGIAPLLIVLEVRVFCLKRRVLGERIGVAMFVVMCWATALSVIMYRIGAFQ